MIKFFLPLILQILVVQFIFPIIHKDFHVIGDLQNSIVIVLIFIALNFAARKLIVILTLGVGALVFFLSLGLAGLVLNAGILLGMKHLFPQMLSVPGFAEAFLGGICLAIANYLGGK
jgi:putative membrane protein